MSAKNLSRFSAVYCSGAYIPDAEAVTALALLFDKVYLPNNIDIVRAFATKFRVAPVFSGFKHTVSIKLEDGGEDNLFEGLTVYQVESAKHYITRALGFANSYSELYGAVFESDMFPEKTKIEIAVKPLESRSGQGGFSATISNRISLATGDECRISDLIREGYVPVVGRFHSMMPALDAIGPVSSKQLATLLAMKSIEMVLPRTRAAKPEVILEARHKLRELLPSFWSAMLKASVELRNLAIENKGKLDLDLSREAADLVDRVIRPAAIDLERKLEMERKDWFYKILSPIRAGLRLLVGSPPLTQEQLITSAMVLASDTCVSIAENMRSIESLKKEAGLAYLLELSDILTSDRHEA
jgi:hypothetical protein